MSAIIISHIADSRPARFQVFREASGQHTEPVAIPSPYKFPVKDRPNEHLISQLRWYLEGFIQYPFPPRTEQAAHVEAALAAWGEQAFRALFQNGKARDWMTDAKRGHAAGKTPLHLQVSSDDPGILSWPWEALKDPETGVLAHQARVERRLNFNLPEPPPLSDQLPKDRIHILLVTARPYEEDVQYRSISRPLVELIETEKLPAAVTLVRPPTFDRLREMLRAKPHFYHILHFDGHGAYRPDAAPGGRPDMFQKGPEGRLIFENEDGQEHPVTAQELSDLLREHAVPVVVLNACQSAMLDAEAADPFASVAAALLRTGIRSVVAMSYSVTVVGAREFLPPFYRGLFATGHVAEAVRRGRQEMRAHPQRSRLDPAVKLHDWLVPVAYQQEPVELAFAARKKPAPSAPAADERLRPGQEEEKERFTFVGRDSVFLALERAMRRKPAGLLIHGLGGIGKTRLARVFLRWLHSTGGLGHGFFWFAFNEIRSAAHVFNEMGRAVFGPQFGALPAEQAMNLLAQAFRQHPFVIVWDNFESVCGIPGTDVTATLPAADQGLLRAFLAGLRGGATKVILTSRSEEDWLGATDCFKVRLPGLRGDEVWDYAAQILDDLGLKVDRGDPDLA
ncbi:MAG: CHAT domain-containing protein, partial [Planctomycetes bacterium]|nr:CHAT domain-containing protein [Planctomycetota bacterium]